MAKRTRPIKGLSELTIGKVYYIRSAGKLSKKVRRTRLKGESEKEYEDYKEFLRRRYAEGVIEVEV